MIYIVEGKLGAGKSLFTATEILERIRLSRKVACNFALNLEHVMARNEVYVIPSRPTANDLMQLGRGGTEHDPGLLVLDECAMFLNSRTYNDKSRQELINWMLHSRKLGWDVYLIVQSIHGIDKQIRDMLAEHLISLKRLDRLKVPLIGLRLPRVHLAITKYGTTSNSPIVERKFFRGSKSVFSIYETNHIFDPTQEEKVYLVKTKPYEKPHISHFIRGLPLTFILMFLSPIILILPKKIRSFF